MTNIRDLIVGGFGYKPTIHFDSHKSILREGDNQKTSIVIVNGWAYRFSGLLHGDRQVINYYLPGDIISPFVLAQPKIHYSVASLTNLNVFIFKPDYLLQMFSAEPRLGMIYGQMLGRENAMITEQIVRLGRCSAYERTAHLLLEFFYRLKLAGLTDKESYFFPLTQE